MSYGFVLLAALSIGQTILLVSMWRRRGDVDTLEERLGRFGDALALLTDTTQAGFSSVADEIAQSRRPKSGTGRTATSRRIAQAVGRGRSVREVAADEQVSESEIRLHLGLMGDRAHVSEPADRNNPVHVFGLERKSWQARSTSH